MNTILYIGLALMALGFISFIVAIIMQRHYEVKLWELEQKRKRGFYE
jgi:uncharacterized protein YoxC